MNRTRPEMSPTAQQIRAYFAPVDRATGTPTAFDAAQHAWFVLDAPPAPWLSLGAVANFHRGAATRIEPVRAGAQAAAIAQFRSQLDARVECDFLEWGKLQMALAAGSEHWNVLAASAAAVPLLSGTTAQELMLETGASAAFLQGDLVSVDVDYAAQAGYVGSGIAGAYVSDAAAITDPDFVRRVSFNVARIAEVRAASLWLAQPLLGGVPPTAAKVQKVVGFEDREGGSFFQEWSALFVVPEQAGGRLCFYYPRLQAAAPAQEKELSIADPLRALMLHAAFLALPAPGAEAAVCHRFYFPAAAAPLY